MCRGWAGDNSDFFNTRLRARAQRTRLDQRTAEITAEHTRIREDMQRLPQNSDLSTRYVKKLDQQETGLENLRKEIERIENMEEEHRRELKNYVMNLDVAFDH